MKTKILSVLAALFLVTAMSRAEFVRFESAGIGFEKPAGWISEIKLVGESEMAGIISPDERAIVAIIPSQSANLDSAKAASDREFTISYPTDPIKWNSTRFNGFPAYVGEVFIDDPEAPAMVKSIIFEKPDGKIIEIAVSRSPSFSGIEELRSLLDSIKTID